MKEEIKKNFPDFPDQLIYVLEKFLFYFKAKSKMKYNFNYDIKFNDQYSSFYHLENDMESKTSICTLNFSVLKKGLIDENIPHQYIISSALGSIISVMSKGYLSGILLHNFFDEISIINDRELIILNLELSHLQFNLSVFYFPEEQITENLDNCLHNISELGLFDDKDQIKDHCLKISSLTHQIILEHEDLSELYLSHLNKISDLKKKDILNKPGNSTDLYEGSTNSGKRD